MREATDGSATPACENLPKGALLRLRLGLALIPTPIGCSHLTSPCTNVAQSRWRRTDARHHWRRTTVRLLCCRVLFDRLFPHERVVARVGIRMLCARLLADPALHGAYGYVYMSSGGCIGCELSWACRATRGPWNGTMLGSMPHEGG